MGVQYVDIDVPHGVAEAVAKVDGVALASLIDEGRFVGGVQAVLCAQDETVDGGYMMRFERTYARPQEDVWRALTRPDVLSTWCDQMIDYNSSRLDFADGAPGIRT